MDDQRRKETPAEARHRRAATRRENDLLHAARIARADEAYAQQTARERAAAAKKTAAAKLTRKTAKHLDAAAEEAATMAPAMAVATLQTLLRIDPTTGALMWAEREAYWFTDRVHGDRVSSAQEQADWFNGHRANTQAVHRKPSSPDRSRYGAVLGVNVLASVAAYAMYHGKWPIGRVWHRDGDAENNREDNLIDDTVQVERTKTFADLYPALEKKRKAHAVAFAEAEFGVQSMLSGLTMEDLDEQISSVVVRAIRKLRSFPAIPGMPLMWSATNTAPAIIPTSGATVQGLSFVPVAKAIILTTPKTEALGGVALDPDEHWHVWGKPRTPPVELRRAVAVLTRGNAYGFVLTPAENKLLDTILETEAKKRTTK